MIHVKLNPDVEARLRAQARARGIETDSYARALIEDAVRAAPIVTRRSQAGRDIEAFLETISENASAMPELPEEAFTRAGFYDDRG